MKIKYPIFFLVSGFWFLVSFYIYADGMSRAETLYLQGSYSDSIGECAKKITRNEDVDAAYYILGMNYLKLNEFDRAREKLKTLLDKYPFSKHKESANLAYADTFFLQQRFSDAWTMYDKIVKEKGKFTPTALLRLSQIALKTGERKLARLYYDTLKEKYPLSLDERELGQLFQASEIFFTVQVGSFINSHNARNLAQKLKGQNLDAYIDELETGQNIFYRVRIGKFSSHSEAQNLKNILQAKGYPAKIFP